MARKDFGDPRDGGSPWQTQLDEGRGPRILIVDDHRDAADSLQMLLETLGYQAEVAYDGDTALRLVETTAFSAVLLDLAMPKMDGFELAARLRTSVATCPPIIAVTGWADFRTQVRARAAGCVCRLVKPVEINELQHWLRSVSSP